MNECIYIYTCICVCVCVYFVYLNVCVCVCAYTKHTHTHARVFLEIVSLCEEDLEQPCYRTNIHTRTCACVHTRACVHIRTCACSTCACVHTRTHICVVSGPLHVQRRAWHTSVAGYTYTRHLCVHTYIHA